MLTANFFVLVKFRIINIFDSGYSFLTLSLSLSSNSYEYYWW